MIRRALLTIAFAATTFATPPVLAADAEWQNHFADAMRSLRRRDFVTSEDACRAAIEGAEAAGVTGQRHESLLLALATVLTRQSKFEEAASTYERVILLRSERIGDENPELAQLLLDAAIARSAAGKPDAARTLAERAVSIREQHYGAEHARVIDALAVAAMIAASCDDVETVETTLLRVETTRNGAEGARARVATHFSSIAGQKIDEGHAAAAARFARRAITNRGDESSMGFDDLFDLAGDYRILGYASCSLDAWDDASEAFRRVIELTEASFGQPMDRDALCFWLTTARGGHRDAADAFLRVFRTSRSPGYGDDWIEQMIAMVLGDTPSHRVLADAATVESPAREERLAEAHFFAAAMHELSGDHAAALEAYEQCVASGWTGGYDVAISKSELRRAGVELVAPAAGPADLESRITTTRSNLTTVRSQLEMLRMVDAERGVSPFTEQWKTLIDAGYLAEAPVNALSPADVSTRIIEVDVAGTCGVHISPEKAGWVWNSADGMIYASGLDH